MVSQLETQIDKLTEALENQTRLYQEALKRSRKAEKCSETFQDQLKQLEDELLSVDLIQDGLKLEKQKVVACIIFFHVKVTKDRDTANHIALISCSIIHSMQIMRISKIRHPVGSSNIFEQRFYLEKVAKLLSSKPI